jgi:hypothetical protein
MAITVLWSVAIYERLAASMQRCGGAVVHR